MLYKSHDARCMLHIAPSESAEACQAALFDAMQHMVMMFTPLIRLAGGIDTPNAPFVCGVEAPMGRRLNGVYFAEILQGLGDTYDPAATVALVGYDHWFVDVNEDAELTPVRYQYLMRRRADFTHDGYCARYRDIHSSFGVETPGIVGYNQFHVDLGETQALATELGLQFHEVDSVSELYINTLGEFYAALAGTDGGVAAAEDEEKFVDRAASQMYTSTVHRKGEFHDIGADVDTDESGIDDEEGDAAV